MTQLEPLTQPTADDALAWIRERCDGQLATARELVQRLTREAPTDAMTVLESWNDIEIASSNAGAAASVYAETHPDAAVREAADQAMQRVDEFTTDLGLDRAVFDILGAVDPSGLDDDARRLLEKVLRDYRRSGVDRDEDTRARLRELAAEQLRLSQQFSRHIREGVRSIRVRPEDLAGMPDDWLADHPAEQDGLVTVTTDYPDSVPLIIYCSVPRTRRAMTMERLNVAWPGNDAVLRQLVDLRQEQAQLLGYRNWADYDAEIKMIGDSASIAAFIERITQAAQASAERDKQVLLERMRRDVPEASDIDAADSTYYSEVVRREDYAVDAQLTRTYFSFDKVRAGLLAVTGRLFGLTFEPVGRQVAWHEEVASFDVLRDGDRIGRIHLDLHPRDGKYKHAAQFDLVSGVSGRQLAEGVLLCNFSRGLMEHSEVVTLFHEFGHLIHHVVAGDQRWVRFSGVATEWDFVEAPSQMLEEWAWDSQILALFATDQRGEVIPADLVDRMRKADDFGKGFAARTQMFYAALSLNLHTQRPDDITAMVRQLQAKYSVFPYIPDTHFHCAFGHLDGYSSGYYTYMWSLVIAKDMFSAFDRANLFDESVAARYRDTVLARGGCGDAADLVKDFLGRPYTFDAYAEWLAQ